MMIMMKTISGDAELPNYTFLDRNTGEYQTLNMSMSEREEYLKQNPTMQQVIHSAPALGDPHRLGLKKPDNAFRDRLKEIKKAHSRGFTKSTINTF
jgi:hypothetical protein